MKPETRPLLLIASVLSAALVAACGGGGDSPSSTPGASGQDAQANKVVSSTTPVSASVTPVSYVVGGSGWISAPPAAFKERNTTPMSDSVAGTSYYVDIMTGNDLNPGTINAPWKTLAKASAAPLKAGDALLLKCGSVWRDSLEITSGTAKEGGFLIGGYGDCSGERRPIIRASDWIPQDNWTQEPGTDQPVYKRPWTGAAIKRVFANGAPMLPARYPNFKGIGAEFALAAANGPSSKSFKLRAADLQAIGGRDLVGATIHVRTVQWLLDTATVTAFDPSTGVVTLDRAVSTGIREGAGYVLEGKRWMVDSPNEWFYDQDTKELVLSTPAGTSPALNSGLEAVTRDYGLTVKWLSGVRIERVRTEQQSEDGIRLIEMPDSTVSDVAVVHPYQLGISALSSPRVKIKDSTVHGAGRRAIVARASEEARITGNQVTDTGGFGRSDDTEAAISVYGANSLVSGNYITRAASVGIHFQNLVGVLIENNTVYQPCLRHSDCAGIYTFTAASGTVAPATSYSARALVRNNVIVGVYANSEGCGTQCDNLATGFYLDEMTSGVTVQNNVVSSAEIGIALHNAHFNVIDSNIVRKTSFAAIRNIQTRSNNALFTGNQFLNNSLESSKVMDVTNGLPVEKSMAHAFYWFHPSNPQSMFTSNGNVVKGNKILSFQQGSEATWGLATWSGGSYLKASEWKAYAPTDAAVSPINYRALLVGTEANLVPNGDFNPSLGAWTTYFDASASGGSFSMGNFSACGSATCGRHVAASAGDQMLSGSFKMNATSGQNLYVFRMTATSGATETTRNIGLRRATSPWDNYGLGFKVTVPAGQTVQVERFFQSKSADAGILELRTIVGAESFTRGVSVSRVTSIELMPRNKLEVNVINPTAAALSFPCVALNLSTCDAIDEAGNKVSWPLVVPARGSTQVYARDGKWKL